LARTKYGDNLVIIEWHPYPHDVFNLNPDDTLRVNRYQHNPGQPSLILDGYRAVEMPSDPAQFYSVFDNVITVVKSDSTFMMVVVDSATADSSEARVFVRLAADSTMPGAVPTLYCVFTADSLVDELGGAYFRVPIGFAPDRNGVPLSLVRGDTFATTLSFPVSGHRPDKLGAALFVEDASGTEAHRVLQSATVVRFTVTEDK